MAIATHFLPLKKEYHTTADYIVVLPWLLYMVISPLYLFPQGMPQVADFVLALGALPTLALAFLNDQKKVNMTYMFGFGFAILTVAVNLLNYLYFPHQRFLLSAIYYVYNFIVFIYVVRLFRQEGDFLVNLTRYAIYGAVLLQLFWVLFLPGNHGFRETGSFNNPNQLAYWSLLMAGMLVLIRHKQRFSWADWSVMGILGFFEVLALSKSGLITFPVFLSALLFSGQIPKILRAVLLMGLVFVLIFLAFDRSIITPSFLHEGNAVFTALERLENIGQEQDDSFEGRGYYRLFSYPEYILVGAGEGAYTRFDEPRELHSGLATILFSYGILGFLLFSGFLATVFFHRPYYYLLILIPVLMFSVSSHTIRFTHTWVFFALAYTATRTLEQRKGIEKL
jgi:hypothetical protein